MHSAKKEQSVYSILSNIVKLKFHSQLKDCGITFERIYLLTNLQTSKESYVLILNNKKLKFSNTGDFVYHFSSFLISNLKYYDSRYKELKNISMNEFTDEVGLTMSVKSVCYYHSKQLELLKLFAEFQKNISKKHT